MPLVRLVLRLVLAAELDPPQCHEVALVRRGEVYEPKRQQERGDTSGQCGAEGAAWKRKFKKRSAGQYGAKAREVVALDFPLLTYLVPSIGNNGRALINLSML